MERYTDLMNQLNGVTTNIRRKLILSRSDQYIGDSDVRNVLFSTIIPPTGYTVQSIDSFIFDSNPDENGVAQVYVRYTVVKSRFTGSFELGSGCRIASTKTKSQTGIFNIKILK